MRVLAKPVNQRVVLSHFQFLFLSKPVHQHPPCPLFLCMTLWHQPKVQKHEILSGFFCYLLRREGRSTCITTTPILPIRRSWHRKWGGSWGGVGHSLQFGMLSIRWSNTDSCTWGGWGGWRPGGRGTGLAPGGGPGQPGWWDTVPCSLSTSIPCMPLHSSSCLPRP